MTLVKICKCGGEVVERLGWDGETYYKCKDCKKIYMDESQLKEIEDGGE